MAGALSILVPLHCTLGVSAHQCDMIASEVSLQRKTWWQSYFGSFSHKGALSHRVTCGELVRPVCLAIACAVRRAGKQASDLVDQRHM